MTELRSRWARLTRTTRTIANLAPGQIAARLGRMVRTRLLRFHPPAVPDDAALDLSFVEAHLRLRPIGRDLPERTAAGTFAILNHDWRFDGWRLGDCGSQRLETITLHYHEWFEPFAAAAGDGCEASADHLRRYWRDWLGIVRWDAEGIWQLAWNPYAIATRVQVWLRCLCVLPNDFWTNALPRHRVVHSLFVQAAALRRQIEWDIRANHLYRNGVGLTWIGHAFGDSGRRWRAIGESILEQQTNHQLLPSGLHFERSAHYHFEFLDDLIAASVAASPEVSNVLDQAIGRAAAACERLRHPDGLCHGFDDGQVEWPATLIAAATRIATNAGPPKEPLADGLLRLESPPWVLLADLGSPGPREQPGHAHADALTFELSVGKHRLVVDPGTFHYDPTARRASDRATRSHNVVCVDGADSSEVWHLFRMGRRERTVIESVDEHAAIARHDGYRLRGFTILRRFEVGRTVQLRDEITRDKAGKPAELTGGYLVPGEWTALLDGNEVMFSHDGTTVAITIEGVEERGGRISLRAFDWSPRYLVSQPASRLEWSLRTTDGDDAAVVVTTTFRIVD